MATHTTDIDIDFIKASNKWLQNKYKTSRGIYKYYCKYNNCNRTRMIYKKNDKNYKLNIYSIYCSIHNERYNKNKSKDKSKDKSKSIMKEEIIIEEEIIEEEIIIE